MAYRIHRGGYIQTNSLEVAIPREVYRRAMQVGFTKQEGIERELEDYLGLDIEGVLRHRVLFEDEDTVTIELQSDWVRPSRSR